MNSILICTNLGLGDAIICNAIFRHYAKSYDLVCIPVKHHNLPSVNFMLRDVPNIVLRGVTNDVEALLFLRNWKGHKKGLGAFSSDGTFKASEFDRSFYKQAGVEFDCRWDQWKCVKDEKRFESIYSTIQNPPNETPFAFVHDDPKRGMLIDDSKIECMVFSPTYMEIIFDYWPVIESAAEIHCINSSFALFIDSIPLPKNPRLCLHLYARPGGEVPTFRKNWEMLK